MRVVIQRVTSAAVRIEGDIVGQIRRGLLVFVGITAGDTEADSAWLAKKVATLRIFADADGTPNLDLEAVNGEVLVVSQFTLYADARKGTRPSYIRAARPEIAEPLYEHFLAQLQLVTGKLPKRGQFGADMQVSLTNDGPITIIIDTPSREAAEG